MACDGAVEGMRKASPRSSPARANRTHGEKMAVSLSFERTIASIGRTCEDQKPNMIGWHEEQLRDGTVLFDFDFWIVSDDL